MQHALSKKVPGNELQLVYQLQKTVIATNVPAPVRRVIGLIDGHRTAAQVLHDARISEDRGILIIRKLTRQAIIEPSRDALERADTLRDLPSLRHFDRANENEFTAEEEAFFASEVQLEEEPPPPTFLERLSLIWTDWVLSRV
jgi:hypothetical protein